MKIKSIYHNGHVHEYEADFDSLHDAMEHCKQSQFYEREKRVELWTDDGELIGAARGCMWYHANELTTKQG